LPGRCDCRPAACSWQGRCSTARGRLARAQTATLMTPPNPAAPIVGVVGYGVTGRRLGTFLLRQGTNVAIFDPAVSGGPRGAVRGSAAGDLSVTDVVARCL